MIRIGIIGCGMIAQKRHAPEYAADERVQLAAFYDALPARAQELSDQYGGRAYADWKELIEQGDLDAVSVCSPNATHAEIAVYALEHGLHVLCEKPMATSLADCERMARAAKQANKLLFIGQNQRLAPAHVLARELIQKGEIGRPLTFQTAFGHEGPEVWTKTSNTWFYDRKKAAFGAVFDLGIHKVDLMEYLLGEPVVAVSAMLGTLDKKDAAGAPIGVEDNAVCLLRTRGGALGQLAASWTYYGGEVNSARVYGSEGVLCIYEDEARPLVLRRGGEVREYPVEAPIQTNDNQFDSGVIRAFVDDIALGRPATISGESVCRAMRAVFAAIESAQTGRTVELPPC